MRSGIELSQLLRIFPAYSFIWFARHICKAYLSVSFVVVLFIIVIIT